MQKNYNNWFHLAPHFLYNLQMRLFNHSYKNKQYREHQSKDSRQKSALNRKQTEKQKTREKWLAKKTEMLVKLWVENQVWPRIADEIFAQGSSKTIKQCKVKYVI